MCTRKRVRGFALLIAAAFVACGFPGRLDAASQGGKVAQLRPLAILRTIYCDPKEPTPSSESGISGPTWLEVGDQALAKHKCREAINDYEAALAQNGDNQGALLRASFVEFEWCTYVGDFKVCYQASHHLDKLIAAIPNSAPLLILRAAATLFEVYDVRLHSGGFAVYGMKRRLDQMYRFAEDDLEHAMAVDPNAGEAYTAACVTTAYFGEVEKRKLYLARAQQLDPVGLHVQQQFQQDVQRKAEDIARQQERKEQASLRAISFLFSVMSAISAPDPRETCPPAAMGGVSTGDAVDGYCYYTVPPR